MQVEDELLNIDGMCRFWGGDTPLHPSSIYRGIQNGIFPPPIHVGPNLSRWLRSEQESARAWRIAQRDGRTRATSWLQWVAEQQSEEAA
jgi:predicted DNA-binding transcriptional regulator AlpA